MEVRQALALIKDRVDEIKQDNDWKDKLKRDHDREVRIEDIRKERRDADAMSVVSSQMSQKSLKNEVLDKIKEEQKGKQPEWDTSTHADHEAKDYDPEKLLASRLANEILEQNPVSEFTIELEECPLKTEHERTFIARSIEAVIGRGRII